MASGRMELPDTILTKYYKCHPQSKVGAVVCIMCGNLYHTNKIVSRYNSGCPVKFIDNALIICQDHPNVALSSNLPYDELSSEAKQLIAQIKLTTREQIKQEIISEINLEKHNNNQKGHNDTVYEDYSEFESLKIENQLLKQLNNELQDKNRILNELLTKEKQGNYNNIKTIAEITANPKTNHKKLTIKIIQTWKRQFTNI